MEPIIVYLNDNAMDRLSAKRYFFTAHKWALNYCSGYLNYQVEDVADFSHLHDLVAQYIFDNEQDAMVFKLKWT